jgi:hypothetical protein
VLVPIAPGANLASLLLVLFSPIGAAAGGGASLSASLH